MPLSVLALVTQLVLALLILAVVLYPVREKWLLCGRRFISRQQFADTGSNVVLTPADIKLLKELKGAGERGRTIHAFNTRVALQRLAKGGYVIARTGDDGLVNYRIAKRGADAIAENE